MFTTKQIIHNYRDNLDKAVPKYVKLLSKNFYSSSRITPFYSKILVKNAWLERF